MNDEVVGNWLRKAENDLQIGKDEMAVDTPVMDMVCFHMQQCCEKCLKAFLIFHAREYPRTHRLAALVTLCAEIDPEFLMISGVEQLSRYATTLRYGEEFYMPTFEETQQAIQWAERVREFVLQKLREAGYRE